MEAAFVEIGLEKNGLLYVDEIVSPELERGHGRKIQDLISRGQTILVQAVKDPMKTKGARLTTQISLPGRFVVLVPQGEGLGVSRRLDDDERNRLKDILKRLDVKEGGVIVRTAAEGASEEDIERDLVFLQRLWKSIQAKAKSAKAPELVYQEAELPLRVVRDLFTGDFEKAYVDDELTYKRVVGYLKKTSPHMVERLVRYKDKQPLMEAFGVEQEIKSTIGRQRRSPLRRLPHLRLRRGVHRHRRRRRPLRRRPREERGRPLRGHDHEEQPRGGEGGRPPAAAARHRRDHRHRLHRHGEPEEPGHRGGGAAHRARARPDEDVRRRDLAARPRGDDAPERDGRPSRGDDAQVPDLRRRRNRLLRGLRGDRRRAAVARARRGSRAQAFRVELADPIASALVGPGARRLIELEALTKKRFFLEGKPETHLDHFVVLSEGKLADLAPPAPVGEDAEVMLQLVEVDRYDGAAAVGKLDGLDVVVADAASLVGKRVKVRVERVLDGRAYAVAIRKTKAAPEPLTAEGEAEKPTRKPPARKGATVTKESESAAEEPTVEADEPEAETEGEETPEAEETPEVEDASPQAPAAKKKTRRGSRGGRKRKKAPATAEAAAAGGASEESSEASRGVTIHIPGDDLGRGGKAKPVEEAPAEPEPHTTEEPTAVEVPAQEPPEVLDEPGRAPAASPTAPAAKKKTRRGSRGGKNRKKKPAAASQNGAEAATEAEPAAEADSSSENDDFDYVPMSESADELDTNR